MKRTLIFLLSLSLLTGCFVSGSKGDAKEERYQFRHRTIDLYDYTKPVPECVPVDSCWFEDSLFLGDTRLSGLYNYSSLRSEGADVHYISGLELETFDTASADTCDGNYSLGELLLTTEKKSVFLMLGINDLDQEDTIYWSRKVKDLVQNFRKKYSSTQLYFILPYHVEALDGVDADMLEDRMDMIREATLEIAQEYRCFCIDAGEALENSFGVVDENYVWDGVRLNAAGSEALVDYISRHIVREEDYVKEIYS